MGGKDEKPGRAKKIRPLPQAAARLQDEEQTQRDLTERQRERTRELISKGDRRIALIFIAEGLAKYPAGCRAKSARARFVDSVRRTVNNHRNAIKREEWSQAPLPELGDPVATQEFIARLKSRIEDIDDEIDKKATKSTARINAFAEIRQIETLIAKVSGVDIEWKRFGKSDNPEDADQQTLPFVGVVLDWKNVSTETKDEIERERARRDKRSAAAAARKNTKVPVQR